MTSYANGRVPLSALTEIAPGQFLSKPTARAYKRFVAAAAKKGWTVKPAGPGASYRSYNVQDEFHRAGAGNRALAIKWGLNPNSSIKIAAAGYSSHGYATRIDLLFNGSSWPNEAQLALARAYGFTREFGANDPNHFEHDGKTQTALVVAKAPKVYHVVKSGEVLVRIADANKTTVAKLVKLNKLASANKIFPGQKLRIR